MLKLIQNEIKGGNFMNKSIVLMLLGLIIMLFGIFSTEQLGVLFGSIVAAIGGLILGGTASTLAIKKLGS